MIKRLVVGAAALLTLRALVMRRGGACSEQRHNRRGNVVGRPGPAGLRHRGHRGNVTPFDGGHRFRHAPQPVSV
jgi:hypothetical protein